MKAFRAIPFCRYSSLDQKDLQETIHKLMLDADAWLTMVNGQETEDSKLRRVTTETQEPFDGSRPTPQWMECRLLLTYETPPDQAIEARQWVEYVLPENYLLLKGLAKKSLEQRVLSWIDTNQTLGNPLEILDGILVEDFSRQKLKMAYCLTYTLSYREVRSTI